MIIMHQTHQDEPGDDDDQSQVDATTAAAGADTGAESPFRKGVELAGGAIDPDELPTTAPPAKDEAPAEVDNGVDDEGNPIVADGEQPAPAAEEEADEDAEAAAKAEADKKHQEQLEKDVAELTAEGAKPKTIERFKALTNRVRELETEREQIPALTQQAQAAVKWEEAVLSTGADPEQFARTMGYLQVINRGTIEQKRQALTQLQEEVKWLSKEIGVKADGYDPLDEHEDLKARVQRGEIDEADALDLVEARRLKKERDQGTEQQSRAQLEQTALAQITALGNELKAKDPMFAHKLKVLGPTIKVIQARVHPSEWRDEVEKAYKALPKMAPPAPAKPRPTTPPMRPSGGGAEMKPEVTSTNAFSMGVKAAKSAGR